MPYAPIESLQNRYNGMYHVVTQSFCLKLILMPLQNYFASIVDSNSNLLILQMSHPATKSFCLLMLEL